MTDTQTQKRPGLARIIWGAVLLAYGMYGLVTIPAAMAGGDGATLAGAAFGTIAGLAAGVLLLVFGILARRR